MESLAGTAVTSAGSSGFGAFPLQAKRVAASSRLLRNLVVVDFIFSIDLRVKDNWIAKLSMVFFQDLNLARRLYLKLNFLAFPSQNVFSSARGS
jgi:hypothetical protein